MDNEGLGDIYNVVWNAVAKKLGNYHFKIALLVPQGYRGDERFPNVRNIKVDTKKDVVTLTFADGHVVRFSYDPEPDLDALLYGAMRRGSPDYEHNTRYGGRDIGSSVRPVWKAGYQKRLFRRVTRLGRRNRGPRKLTRTTLSYGKLEKTRHWQ